jgi:predicted nucleic acid-binding Zn finger protein
MSQSLTTVQVSALGGVLLADNKTHTNRIEIKSESSNRLYIVSQAKASGEWQCSCPGWVIKRPGKPRGCKHLRAMQPALEAAVRGNPALKAK